MSPRITAAYRRQVARALPDAIELLGLVVRAGLGLDAALGVVADATSGPLALELQRVRREVSLGRSRGEALRDLADRVRLPELTALASALAQAESTGAPVVETLQSQSATMRDRAAMRAEEVARQLPVKLVVPLVLCVLPALLVVVVGPAIVSVIEGSLFG